MDLARSVRRLAGRARRRATSSARPSGACASPPARRFGPEPPRLAGPPPTSPVSDLLHARLDAGDVEEVERRLEGDNLALWSITADADRRQLVLAFGVHYRVESVLAKTGLRPDEPPPDVHAMARGSLSAGGGYHDADFLIEALERTGPGLRPDAAALDFGCSSGRVVRVLQAAFPDVVWHGCDPIPAAIAWASPTLAPIEFAASSTRPPLPYDDGAFQAVFAVSVWSHFGPEAARAWFDEMARIIEPAGRLVFTTHGRHSMAHDERIGLRDQRQLAEIDAALDDEGYWYSREFGEQGDHGVVDPQWGTAFIAPGWLLATLSPPWRALSLVPGRNAGVQDVVVLQRPDA